MRGGNIKTDGIKAKKETLKAIYLDISATIYCRRPPATTET